MLLSPRAFPRVAYETTSTTANKSTVPSPLLSSTTCLSVLLRGEHIMGTAKARPTHKFASGRHLGTESSIGAFVAVGLSVLHLAKLDKQPSTAVRHRLA
mmetsp:Transcript_21131/g.45784  ORF Transcript_21131/g.45784 Transcript_21131/m.45784 type:complete len:99 (+) Transcript_21131:237-533(+)